MKTLIDRIIKKIGESPREDYRPDKEKQLRQILEAELTAVKGVDEFVEKRTKAEGVVAKSGYILVDEFISDLKSLKQTPVKDSQPKEVEMGDELCMCGGSDNDELRRCEKCKKQKWIA